MTKTAICDECGAEFNDDFNSVLKSRKPCPVCGSTNRRISGWLELKESHHDQMSGTVLISAPNTVDLLLQTVVIPGLKTDEGRLIEAVAEPWFEIIALINRDPSIAYQIKPRKWEEIIAGGYERAGFDEVTLTPSSGDFGRDIIAVKYGIGTIRVIDQVKAFKPGHFVTANDVRALLGVLQGDTASKGFLTTTSDFAPRLRDDPLIKPHVPARIGLINGEVLFARLNDLAKRRG